MSTVQAFLIAVLQGATELFPISSLGHAVVLPALLGWGIDQQSDAFLPFLVLLHTGTAAALLLYFWRDWLGLARGVTGLDTPERTMQARRLFLRIVVATIPAVILGFAFNHFLKTLFGAPSIAAVFLMLNGVMLLVGERLRGAAGVVQTPKPLGLLTVTDAAIIGVWQCVALLPGLSRAGATMVGGLLRGLDHENAARFSFLIALPIIVGATVLEVPKLRHTGIPDGTLLVASMAAVAAGVTAWLATAFLMRYFRGHDAWALRPFAYYCLGFGGLCLVVLSIR